MNRFRRLLIHWEKRKVNFLNMIHLACAVITFRTAGVFGEALRLWAAVLPHVI